MSIIGIVVEYNPFHNGHLYQIEKIKEKYNDSTIIVVMSPSFTQRGNISILNKFDKAKIAINYGVDIVIELPTIYSTQSADNFAFNSIALLNELKIDTLIFGSESTDINKLTQIAKIQDTKKCNDLTKEYLDLGLNYPTALSKAIEDLIKLRVDNPNELLAISYIKAIQKVNRNINIDVIKRTNEFHDKLSNNKVISAENIREKLNKNKNIKKYMPKLTYKYLKDKNIDYELYFNLLKYKINTEEDLNKYLDVNEGISTRIKKYINKCNSIDELILNIKSKRWTYNKISRMLIHILLNITKKDAKEKPKYIRILGLSSNGQKYLNSIKKNTKLELLSKYNKLLDKEINVTSIYSIITNEKELVDKEYKFNPFY